MANSLWTRPCVGAVKLLILIWILFPVAGASAQLQNLYPNFFQLKPDVLDVVAFGGGFGSEKYGSIQEGVQLDQRITRYIGAVGRVTGYQLWIGDNFDNPLAPGTGHQPRLNFARLQGGVEFDLYPGTTLFILGGKDVGDSTASVIEGDGSSWLFSHSQHPVNFSFSASHDYENHVTAAEIDVRAVVSSTERYLITAGGGGAIYQGGEISSAAGQGGPDLGIYFRRYALGLALQGGYGNAGGFGQLSIIKQWDFPE
ncbi:MAG: hypothetical protein ACLQU2_26755 [Candidatus Binataceae bacterium]